MVGRLAKNLLRQTKVSGRVSSSKLPTNFEKKTKVSTSCQAPRREPTIGPGWDVDVYDVDGDRVKQKGKMIPGFGSKFSKWIRQKHTSFNLQYRKETSLASCKTCFFVGKHWIISSLICQIVSWHNLVSC